MGSGRKRIEEGKFLHLDFGKQGCLEGGFMAQVLPSKFVWGYEFLRGTHFYGIINFRGGFDLKMEQTKARTGSR